MRSFFLRTLIGILIAVALSWAGGSGLFVLATLGPPSEQLSPVLEEQLAFYASGLEELDRPEREARLHQIRRVHKGPIDLRPPGAEVPPGFVSHTLADGSSLSAPPPPARRPPWAGLLVQGSFILLCASAAAWLLAAPLLRDLKRLETAVGNLRHDELETQVPEPPGPIQPLAVEINRLTGRIRALVHGQRDLLRAVSHELRTPLARLRFQVEELAEGADPALVRAVDDELDEVDNLIGELLDWLSAEVPAGELTEVQPRELLEKLPLRHGADALHFDLDVSVETVRSHERDLERILDNLVGNAVRYAASTIRVTAKPLQSGWVLAVEDDGRGFPEDAERLLEPFATADAARTDGRSGLGLSIVQRIVKRLDGQLTLGRSSTLGGAQVTVVLP